jgi:hypothetical protein
MGRNDNIHTPKKVGVEWKADSGEAGNFVETYSRGGIIGYEVQVRRGEQSLHFLT